MNIKAKRTICLACCTAVVLGGCRGVSDSAAPTEQSAAETKRTTAAETTLASESTSAIGAIVDLDGEIISLADMYNKKGYDYDKEYYCKDGSRFIRPCDYTYDENEGALVRINNPNGILTRPGFLYVNEKDVPDGYYDDYAFVYKQLDYSNPYNFYIVPQKIYCTEADITAGLQRELVEPTVVEAYYSSEEVIVVNAFLNSRDGDLHFYIDPAYTMGLPCINGNIQPLVNCSINGVDVVMSTLEFTGNAVSEEAARSLKDVGEEYVYARLTLGMMSVHENAPNETSVITAEIIEQDASAALDKVYLDWETSTEKDKEREELYNLLAETIDEWNEPALIGINVIDLDNSGTPEVFFSYQYTPADAYETGCDITTKVNVFKDGELKQIGELNTYRDYHDALPEIKSRTLEDGTVEWLYNSSVNYETGERQNVTYTIKLVDGELVLTEIFRVSNESIEAAEDDKTEKYEIYYMGEKFQAGTPFFEEVFAAYKNIYGFEYSPSMAYSLGYHNYGDVSALGDLARDYYSDRFDGDCYSLVGEMFYYDGFVFELYPMVTDRMLKYEIAAQIDAAYGGAYNPALIESSVEYAGVMCGMKPIIYLYPEEQTDVSVDVSFTDGGGFTCTYPEYGDGWNVAATPDGTLYDENGNEYYCLYWEGELAPKLDRSEGWCVSGEESAEFLREKLLEIGLTAREANEFIIYWLPQLQKNPYNIITFHTDDYAELVPLTVTPVPDSVIRVFMTFEASDDVVEIPPQTLPRYERNGFTVVEWGGAEIN